MTPPPARLPVRWREAGAGDGIRTRDPELGKLVLWPAELHPQNIPYYITVNLFIISQMSERRTIKHLITEKINRNTVNIDKLSVREAIDLICEEDKAVFEAVSAEKGNIAAATDLVIERLKHGGRIFFAGAGTSGRLGVLEAAECPPTFGTSPELFQAVIAGGKEAVWSSAEGAEDLEDGARSELAARGLNSRDGVIGIAASSTTPFVKGALEFGVSNNCRTVLISCNPVEKSIADINIALPVGPEVIVGSTRMKSGTATKMVLNMITTTAMVQMGKTYGNLMVDLKPQSEKLRSRAVSIVTHICGLDENEAYELLEKAEWSVKAAVLMEKRDLGFEEAKDVLERCDGFLYLALGNRT